MRLALLVLALAAAALTGCGGEQRATVDIRTFDFQPDPVKAPAGTKVTFVNHDAIGHTVTSGTRKQPDGRFDSKLKASTGKTTITFDDPGRYRYFCAIHPGSGMTGEVIIT